MNMKTDLEEKLQVATILEGLADKFLTAPKTEKLKKFAEFLLNDFTIPEIERGLSDIQPGERFPSLSAIKSAIYPHRTSRESGNMGQWITQKIASEEKKVASALSKCIELGMTKEEIGIYVKGYIQAVHGKGALEMLTPIVSKTMLMRPAMIDLYDANFKPDKAISLGRERVQKIKRSKPESKQRFEIY